MKKVVFYAGTAILLWSSMPTISKLLISTMDQNLVLCLSALFAAVGLFLVNLFTGKLKKLKQFTPWEILRSILIGLPGTFLYYVFYYEGTRMMAASQAFIINYLWPMMSVVFACILMKEKLSAPKLIALLLSFAGVFTVAGGDILQMNEHTLLGAVFCILAAVSYGSFTAMQKKWSADDELTLMLSFAATFVCSLVMCFAGDVSFVVTLPQTLGLLLNGVGVMAVATTLWATALAAGDTAKVSTCAYITPFLSLVWTFLFLKETPNLWILGGLALIMCGILIQLKAKAK